VSWLVRWLGMLITLFVAVVTVPGPVDGVAYLTGAAATGMFDPVSYRINCAQSGCDTSTAGVLLTAGRSITSTWPDVVPLGKHVSGARACLAVGARRIADQQ
jgi:hypothetical protein